MSSAYVCRLVQHTDSVSLPQQLATFYAFYLCLIMVQLAVNSQRQTMMYDLFKYSASLNFAIS